LAACGLLTVVDRAALEAYCESYAQWKEAMEALRENGLTFATETGYVQQRPEVAIANSAPKAMRAFMGEFGMTPSSRSRVRVPGKGEEADPFAEFLAQSKVTEQLDE
jgi:P27 family predicted phage terminase small subunit